MNQGTRLGRSDPFRRTLYIFAATTVVTTVVFFVIGAQLLAPASAAIGAPPDGFAAQEVVLKTKDGIDLDGWLAGPADPTAVVILMHPVLTDRRRMQSRAGFLVAAGYGVLMFDSRAHGTSGGDRITFGLRESQDALAVVAFARRLFPDVPVLTLGVSLGGGATLLAATEIDVDGMILESVFPDLATAVSNRLRLRLGRIGVYLAPLFARQLAWRLDAASEDFWTFARAPIVRAPVLVIAASADRRVESAHLLQYYDLFGASKSIWLVGGAVHQDLHWFASAEYESRVLRFIEHVTRGFAAADLIGAGKMREHAGNERALRH